MNWKKGLTLKDFKRDVNPELQNLIDSIAEKWEVLMTDYPLVKGKVDKDKEIYGTGAYTIDENGKITHIPIQTLVIVKRED